MADDLQQDVFPLAGGLDLVTAKLLVESGTLIDCLNYEVNTVQGYSRIKGFERYDGHLSSEVLDYLILLGDSADTPTDFPVGSLLVNGLGSENVFGIVTGYYDTDNIQFARINQTFEPKPADTVYVLGQSVPYVVTQRAQLPDNVFSGRTADQAVLENNDISAALRARVGSLPGPIVGLHWYRDRLYAVVDEGNGDDTAVLYQSRTEQQAQDELGDASLAGWERIAPGFKVNYINGSADSDMFTKIERGKENNFIYSSGNETGDSVEFYNGVKIPADTPTGGSTGPKVSNGDSGWKASTDTTVYAQDQSALESEDSEFMYGDFQFRATSIVASGDLKASGYNEIAGPDAAEPFDGMTDAGSTNSRVPLVFKNLSLIADLIPENSIITGIEVGINYDSLLSYYGYMRNAWTPRTYVPQWINGKVVFAAYLGEHSDSTNTFTPEGSKQTANHVIHQTPGDYAYTDGTAGANGRAFRGNYTKTDNDLVIGGDGNVFGIAQLSKEDLANPDKALVLFVDGIQGSDYPQGQLSSLGGSEYEQLSVNVRTLLNHLTIKVYYTEPSARYYITDGTGVVSADLVYYTVVEGSLKNGDASGEFQFVNIQNVSGTKTTINDGDTVHVSNPTDPSNQIAEIDGDAVVNGLPVLSQLNAESSRYQFITANFYANADWDGFYLANGAGRGASFAKFDADADGTDENYLVMISTNLFEPEQDKPRHVAYYNNHLVFGLKNGAIRISVVDTPESFSGEDYATQYFGGGPVTGLAVMKGTMLCVGCRDSVSGITGTSADNFSVTSISPKLGCLEYTMQDIGDIVYCSPKGITTLAQTSSYGDFLGNRLSEPVSPWIVPRLRISEDLTSFNQGAGVVCAMVKRSKNQYCVWFRDGKILTMTYKSQKPEFTFQKYYFNRIDMDHEDHFLVPLAWSTQTDQYGVDRIHISHYSNLSEANVPYVLELDRGWGFDGQFIPAYFTINWYHQQSPLLYKTIYKVRVDGLSYGLAHQNMNMSTDYQENWNETVIPMDLPRGSTTYKYDPYPVTEIKDYNKYGRQFSIRFKDAGTLNNPEPSHTNQVLVVWYKGGKLDG